MAAARCLGCGRTLPADPGFLAQHLTSCRTETQREYAIGQSPQERQHEALEAKKRVLELVPEPKRDEARSLLEVYCGWRITQATSAMKPVAAGGKLRGSEGYAEE